MWASPVAQRQRIRLQCRRLGRCGFDPWVGTIPWRRERQPTPVFYPGESHGQRSLAGYSPWGHKGSDTTEATGHARSGRAGVKLDSQGGVGGTQFRGRGSRGPGHLCAGPGGSQSALSSSPRSSCHLGSEPELMPCNAQRRGGGLQELWGPGPLPHS